MWVRVACLPSSAATVWTCSVTQARRLPVARILQAYLRPNASIWRAKVPYFRIYDLRSTYATRLSAGGVADERVTQMVRQGDAQVFTKYSHMKLQMKREALEKLNRRASEMAPATGDRMRTVMVQ